jgi:hypothetical protein
MSSQKLAPFHPPPEVLALGTPEQVFAESTAGARVCRWAALTLGSALLLAGAGLAAWFWLLSPAELRATEGAQIGLSIAAATAAGLGALFVVSGWFYGQPSAYALYDGALALCRRGKWAVLPWCDVKALHPLTLRAFPHLELRDGTKVPLGADGSFFAEELYREVRRNVESPFTISRAEAPAPAPEEKAAEPAAEGQEQPSSPWGMLVGGVGLVLAAAWFFNYLQGVETTGGEIRAHWAIALAYSLGGKWGAAGLVGAIGAGLLISGLNGLINGGKPGGPPREGL